MTLERNQNWSVILEWQRVCIRTPWLFVGVFVCYHASYLAGMKQSGLRACKPGTVGGIQWVGVHHQ